MATDQTIANRDVRHSAGTSEQLLDAAETLIGEQGVDRASVRAITELAGANIAAVSYHFGSKDALVRAVFERRLRPINRRRLELLEELLAEPGVPDVERIVRAFVVPPFHVLIGEQAASFGRCMVRALSDPSTEMRAVMMDVFGEVIQLFTEALQLALPSETQEAIFWRFHFMVGSMAYTVGLGHLVPEYSRGVTSMQEIDDVVEQLVGFVSAGMAAPTGGRRA